MRDVIRVFLLSVLVLGCAPKPAPQETVIAAAVKRAELVKVCRGDLYVGYDSTTKRYVYAKGILVGTARGFIAPGVTPDKFCN